MVCTRPRNGGPFGQEVLRANRQDTLKTHGGQIGHCSRSIPKHYGVKCIRYADVATRIPLSHGYVNDAWPRACNQGIATAHFLIPGRADARR